MSICRIQCNNTGKGLVVFFVGLHFESHFVGLLGLLGVDVGENDVEGGV